jgi:predicted ribosomally synthesized peptide with SipW-like signal peptide
MKQKMVGLFLASLLAVSIVGVTFAYWTDTLTVEGSVTTGTFWGYLTYAGNHTDMTKGWDLTGAQIYGALSGGEAPYYDTLTIYAENVYPGYVGYLDWDMHWMGSVPAHVDVERPVLPDWLEVSCSIYSGTYPDYPYPYPGYVSLDVFLDWIVESQWHECYDIFVCMKFEVIEIDDPDTGETIIGPPQDEQFSFDMVFNFYQYNLDQEPV